MKMYLGNLFGPRAVDPEGHRILGPSQESGRLILGLKGHSITYGANGSGKSTRVAVPALFALGASEPHKAIFLADVKSGEIACQCLEMFHRLGRRVALIDDTGLLPHLAQYRVSLNPFSSIVEAFKRDPRDVIFAIEGVTHTLIEEPRDDAKNRYWRDTPRGIIEFIVRVLLKRDPDKVTPGAVATVLSDPEMLRTFAQIEAEEGDAALRTQAQNMLDLMGHEHWPQHLMEATRALRLYAPGNRLHEAGSPADGAKVMTHAALIREGTIIFAVGSQAQIARMGVHVGLHIACLTDALYHGAGALRMIIDEFTNYPIRELVGQITTLRAFGPSEVHLLAQSPSEVIRKFGEQEARTLEENCITKQWLGFSSFDAAERVSKAIGEEHAVSAGLSGEVAGLKSQESLSLIKQRRYTPSALMAMKPSEQLIHMKGVGFLTADTIAQNQFAPYCFPDHIAPNPLEGGRLPPDSRVWLVTPRQQRRWI